MEHFLKGFHKSGRLIPQKESALRGRYRGSWDVSQLIKALEQVGLITEYTSEKSKKMGQEYQVLRPFHPDVLKLVLEDLTTEALRLKLRELLTK